MRKLINSISIFFTDISYILSPKYVLPKRNALLWDYIRISIKRPFNRFFHYKNERFLGYRVETPEWFDFYLKFRELFVRNVYYFSTAESSPMIVNCGGNVGYSTLYFKYLYPNAKVMVFEPNMRVFEILRNNISRNSLENVELINSGLGQSDGKKELFFKQERGAAGGATVLESVAESKDADIDSFSHITVDIQKLSKYLPEKVDMLKMDVEGSELEILKEIDGEDMLSRVQTMVLEFHANSANENNEISEFLGILKKNNFFAVVYDDEIYPGINSSATDAYHIHILAGRIT